MLLVIQKIKSRIKDDFDVKSPIKHAVCRCGHLDTNHEGFNWFHMTGCKAKDCGCGKYLKSGSYTWENLPRKAIDEYVVDL